MLIYLFTCCYGARHIVHNLRLLSTQVRKHISVWSYNSERNSYKFCSRVFNRF
ncbi:unnamed protein product [Schistosoma curassoni]|uniref:Uncharacterized protein n=1 Tax=Schistosoma curassoni TaxID=6186 RepID=A0A183KRY8_9TREM|nr:unnamed protein product [Schistosoma curassoni]